MNGLGNLELTNQQVQYLLQLNIDEENNTITNMARHFECSKANSKYIMDRMVTTGILYKDKNIYRLTDIGKNLADSLSQDRDQIQESIRVVMKKSDKESYRLATNLMCQEVGDFREELLEFSRYSLHDYKRGDYISYDQLAKLIGPGEKNISYVIYKMSKDDDNFLLQESMAQKAFEEDASLHIGKKSHIDMWTKKVHQSYDGYKKTGVAVNLAYKTNGSLNTIDVSSGKVEIPLETISSWKFLSKNIIQGGTTIQTEAMIGFGKHIEKAIFIFTIDLLDLQKE